jgi:hypothetical protein
MNPLKLKHCGAFGAPRPTTVCTNVFAVWSRNRSISVSEIRHFPLLYVLVANPEQLFGANLQREMAAAISTLFCVSKRPRPKLLQKHLLLWKSRIASQQEAEGVPLPKQPLSLAPRCKQALELVAAETVFAKLLIVIQIDKNIMLA